MEAIKTDGTNLRYLNHQTEEDLFTSARTNRFLWQQVKKDGLTSETIDELQTWIEHIGLLKSYRQTRFLIRLKKINPKDSPYHALEILTNPLV